MTAFRETFNTDTKKAWFYIDGKRVSHVKYDFYVNLCILKDKRMNTYQVNTTKNKQITTFNMN